MTGTKDGNKIKYGMKNVHLFKMTDDGTAVTYGESLPWPGASELSLDANGDALEAYFDDVLYERIENNQGYTGKLTMAYVQPEIEALIVGSKLDDNGGVLENSDNTGSHVGMSFEFSGDKNKVRHVLYNCVFSRPSDGSASRSDKLEAQTSELEFSAMPDPYSGDVKYKAPQGHPMYDEWFDHPVKPGDTPKANAPVAVTGVTLAVDNASIEVGGTAKVTSTVAPDNATDKTVTYKSSDDKLATVSADGTVTGVAAGEATITGTADGKNGTVDITITAPAEA